MGAYCSTICCQCCCQHAYQFVYTIYTCIVHVQCTTYIVNQCWLPSDVYLDHISKLHGGENQLAKTLQPSEYWSSLQLVLKIEHHYNDNSEWYKRTIIAWWYPRRCFQLFEHCRKCWSWSHLRTTIVGILLIFINCNRYKTLLFKLILNTILKISVSIRDYEIVLLVIFSIFKYVKLYFKCFI